MFVCGIGKSDSDMVIAELMILGFISLLLTFGQTYIIKICISQKVADTMLPCRSDGKNDQTEEHRRRLLGYERRFLAGAETTSKCKKVSVYIANSFLGN